MRRQRNAKIIATARRVALERGFAVPGEGMLIGAGIPFGEAGITNLVHITRA